MMMMNMMRLEKLFFINISYSDEQIQNLEIQVLTCILKSDKLDLYNEEKYAY